MTKNKTALVVLIAAAAACVSVQSAGAQSLAEVARQEAARRQAVKSPVRVITNDNLKVVAPALPAVAPGAQPELPAGAAPAEPAPGKPPAAPDATQDPEYWRTRITEARQARDRNAFLIEAVRTRLNSVVADSFSKDDPNKRAQLRIERQQTQDELERMKKDQAELEKKIADIEEEARRANIPPGWLR